MTAKIYQFPARDGRARFKDIEGTAPYATMFRTAHEITFSGTYRTGFEQGSHEIHLERGTCIAHMRDGSLLVADKDTILKTLEALSARAIGRKLNGHFIDTQICLALRTAPGTYTVLQFPLETQNLKKAVPQMCMNFNERAFEKNFTVSGESRLDAGLFDIFNKYGNADMARASLHVKACTQAVRGVYMIEKEGEWKDSRQHFKRGDIVIEYEQAGLILGGPAQEMKKRLIPDPLSL